MRQRRAGGLIGIVIIGAYLVLRLGFIAYREHENGVSTSGIVLTMVVILAALALVSQIVVRVAHVRTGTREDRLAAVHPGAYLVPVVLKRDLAKEIGLTQAMLGMPVPGAPRSGRATLVADANGLGLYTGGGDPQLVLGLRRDLVAHVGDGVTKAAGRYQVGKVESLQVLVSTGQHWTTLDLPVYERFLGYARTLHGERLDDVVQRVSSASGIPIGTVAG